MRFAPVLLLLPVFAAAESQNPLFEKAQEWFDKAKAFIPSTPPTPLDAGAAKVAEKNVEKFDMLTWQSRLTPTTSDPTKGPQELMVLITGNTSCFGECGRVDKAWNVRTLQTDMQLCRAADLDAGISPRSLRGPQCASPRFRQLR